LRAQLALGDDDAARAIAGKLEHGPDWARQYSAALLALQGTAETESDNAMALLRQSHSAAPGEPAPMTALVEALLYRGESVEVRAVLAEWIKTHARDPAAQVLLGRSAEATRQFDEARTHYQRALVLLPSHTAAQTGMARTWLAQRRLEEAQKAAQAAIRLDALAFEPRLLAAEINRAQGNVEEAIRQAGDAAQLDAHDARPHVLLGKIYLERKDYDAAVNAWEQAVALDASASNVATLESAKAARKNATKTSVTKKNRRP
jgi:tetratricopeptide (TPR) repeat protein